VLAIHTPTKIGCSCGKDDCDSIGKHPRWHSDLAHGAHSATTDPNIIKKWWVRWPAANIAIATGENSFDVLDVDVSEAVDGNETLADLEMKHEKLPDTVEQITGGGGRQILFEFSGRMANKVKFTPGLDTRSDGGLIVVPPSLHVSGRRYEWELSSSPDEVSLAKCPEWLLEIIAGSNDRGTNQKCKNPEGWVTRALEGVSEGKRDATGIKLAGYFFGKFLGAKEILAILRLWNEKNSPPMPDSQVEKIVKSGSRWENMDQGHGRIKVNYIGTS
jgi:hypothetical protein